jgi:hypothetical protein
MAGHSRPKDGVASARLCPGHPRFETMATRKTWMPGIADKFTQSAQGRLLRPGMTMLWLRRTASYFFTIEQAGSGGPNASSPEIFARIV